MGGERKYGNDSQRKGENIENRRKKVKNNMMAKKRREYGKPKKRS